MLCHLNSFLRRDELTAHTDMAQVRMMGAGPRSKISPVSVLELSGGGRIYTLGEGMDVCQRRMPV